MGVNDGSLSGFRNQGSESNRVLVVKLVGAPGNPTAVGAVVTVVRSDGLEQTAEVSAGGGYLSQSSAALVFGLGSEAKVSRIQVRWPDGGASEHGITGEGAVIVIEQP